MHQNKHENYEILNLLGYGLAKFNEQFIKALGYQTKTSFYDAMVAHGVCKTGSVVKNRQDLFDPFFDNGRKGWWQKGDTYIHRKHFIDLLFGDLAVDSYAEVIQMYLKERFHYKDEKILNIKPVIKSQFKQLQKTGLEAELYFSHNYKTIELFNQGVIEDARLLGDGYDFQIEVNGDYFLAEVKGVREKRGAIRLTNNEYLKAKEYKDRYILTIISSLNDIPRMTIISNPLTTLSFDRHIISSEQITFNTKKIEW